MLDHSTRWLEVAPLNDVSAATCARTLEQTWIQHYGPPASLHSDRGTQFTSAIMRELVNRYNIAKTQTTTFHPAGNSMIERVHQTLKDHLIVSTSPWIDALQSTVYDINISIHSATGNSQLVFGRSGVAPEDWPSTKRFRNTASFGPPEPGAHVTVKVPNPRPLQPKFTGHFLVTHRPTPNVAVLDNGNA